MATSVTTKTPYGFSVNIGRKATGQTFIHKMANYMWLPMLAMGVMVIAGAFIAGIFQADLASDTFPVTSAGDRADLETLKVLLPGIIFLGVAFLLAGISFLLASVLGAIRWGGGEIQEKHASEVHTPRMPVSAWAFLILMMTGLMVEFGTLGLHIYAAVQVHDYYITGVPPAADAAWYRSMACATGAEIPTTRSFPALACLTRIERSRRSRSPVLTPHSSAPLRPVSYRVSSMARLRRTNGSRLFGSIFARTCRTSSSV